MLKAGIMNNYEFEATEEGSGQGSVCSPIISCIYLYALCADMVVQRGGNADVKGICRSGGLC